MDGKAGYLQVTTFEPCVGLQAAVVKAIKSFKKKGAQGVIVDLRGNGGGNDVEVARLLRSFYKATYQYEKAVTKPQICRDGMPCLGMEKGWGVVSKYTITPAPEDERWQGP